MKRHLSARAINRAHWFTDLSAALDQAERLLSEIIAAGFSPADTERLRCRLIELRVDLVQLNRVRLTGGRIVGATWPDLTNHHPVNG